MAATIDNHFSNLHDEIEEDEVTEEEEEEQDDDGFYDSHSRCSTPTSGMSGWQLAARGIQLALNNRIEDAQSLLKVDSSCLHRQAGYCYLTFIVRNSASLL